MAFVSLSSTDCDAGSPITETLMQLIRTNFDDLDSRIGATESLSASDIRDDFSGAAIDTSLWTTSSTGGGTAPALSGSFAHSGRVLSAAGVIGTSNIVAATNRIRWDITQDGDGGTRVIVMEMRIRGLTAGANRGALIGAQDSALTGSSLNTDISDMIGVYGLNNGSWTVRLANGGANTQVVDVAATTAWHIFKFTITCCPTAGTRKVDVDLDGTPISGSPFTTNLTTVTLYPVAAVAVTANDGSSSGDVIADYFLCYNQNRPLAA